MSCVQSLSTQVTYIRCADVDMVYADFFKCDGGFPGFLVPLYVLCQQLFFVLDALLHIIGLTDILESSNQYIRRLYNAMCPRPSPFSNATSSSSSLTYNSIAYSSLPSAPPTTPDLPNIDDETSRSSISMKINPSQLSQPPYVNIPHPRSVLL